MPETTPFYHLITYSEAGNYLDNINDRELLEISKTRLGGIINASHFRTKVQGNDSGIMIWFCLEEPGGFYLAFEAKSGFTYDPAGIGKIQPAAAELIKGSGIFGYDLSRETDREGYIRSHRHTLPTNEEMVPREKVANDSKNYLSHPVFSKHQKYGFAYFGNKEGHVSTFINQAGLEYIGYYFGYDPKINVNKIRIILVPVGKDGNNLEFDSARSEYQLLERSIPPPPNQ